MELARLYDQYRIEQTSLKDNLQFDMVKRIEAYRRNIDLYNSYGLPKSSTSIPSQTDLSLHNKL